MEFDLVPLLCGPALKQLIDDAGASRDLVALLGRHRDRVAAAEATGARGAWYSQFHILTPRGTTVDIIIGTSRGQTYAALRDEWTALTGEAAPPWPGRSN